MEYAPDGSLRTLIENVKKCLAPKDYSNTTKQILLVGIARGMKYLQDRAIVHRDLKPENILLDENNYPLIIDFGLSKFFEVGHSQSISGYAGTPKYMAPEVYKSKSGTKSDVYSFATIMYEILTESDPFEELGPQSMESFIYKIIKDKYRPKFKKSIKKSFQRLIEQCWSDDPNERPTFNENEKIKNEIENLKNHISDLNEKIKALHIQSTNNLPKENSILNKDDMTIYQYNSLTLKEQESLIPQIISYATHNSAVLVFTKINSLMTFLSEKNHLSEVKWLEILTDNNKNQLLTSNYENCSIKLRSEATEGLFYNGKLFSNILINNLRQFDQIYIEMKYPIDLFNRIYEQVLSLRNMHFNSNRSQLKISILVSKSGENDKNFKSDTNINSIIFDTCVKSILPFSFEGCSSLEHVFLQLKILVNLLLRAALH